MNATTKRYSSGSKWVLFASILVTIFWCVALTSNIYHFAFTGAIFELLWLPMILFLFVLPVISIVNLIKEKKGIRSLYFYALIIQSISVGIILFYPGFD
jgi:hypothetical protein